MKNGPNREKEVQKSKNHAVLNADMIALHDFYNFKFVGLTSMLCLSKNEDGAIGYQE